MEDLFYLAVTMGIGAFLGWAGGMPRWLFPLVPMVTASSYILTWLFIG